MIQYPRWLMGLLPALLLAACASAPPAMNSLADTPVDSAAFSGWQHWRLPGKQATEYLPARLDGRDAMAVTADASASLLRRQLRIEPRQLGSVRFSWKVPALLAESDLARRETADSVVRVVLTFEGDRSNFTPGDRMLSELAQLLTGEPLPHATLMYVWCNTRAPGSVIRNPRTDRVRKLVVESGSARLNQWLEYERDIRADYKRVFGEEPGALLGVAIMTDSDNTRAQASAWYGPVRLDAPLLANR